MNAWEYWTRAWLIVLRRWESDLAEVLAAAERRRERHSARVYDLESEREKRRMRA